MGEPFVDRTLISTVMLQDESKILVTTLNTWISASAAFPADAILVLVALNDNEVWTGFRDAGRWRYVSGDLIGEFDEQDGTDTHVTHWAHFPPPPGAPQ